MDIQYYSDKKLEGIQSVHLNSLVEFDRLVWDENATVESYLESRAGNYLRNPFVEEHGLPLVLLVDGDKVVGQCSSIPCKIWANKREEPMFWNAGLFLLPECRGKGLGLVLPEELTNRLPIISGFFVVPQQLRTHQKLGFHIVGKISDYLKIYKPYNFIKNLDLDTIGGCPDIIKKIFHKKNKLVRIPASFGAAALINLVQMFKGSNRMKNKRDITFTIVDEFDSRVDDLWDKVKQSIKFAQVRNSAYMNWQFKTSKGWKKIIIEEKGKLVGFALIAIRRNSKTEKLANLKIVSTIDLVWDFDKNYLIDHYLDFVDNFATQSGADVTFCSINQPEAVSRLKKFRYYTIPDSVYFVVRSQREDVQLSGNIDDWFLTRGDADAAGSLEPNI